MAQAKWCDFPSSSQVTLLCSEEVVPWCRDKRIQTKCSHTRCKTVTTVLLNMHVLWTWQCSTEHQVLLTRLMTKVTLTLTPWSTITNHNDLNLSKRVNILLFTLICTMQHFWSKLKKKPNDYQNVNKRHAGIGAFNKQMKTQHQFRINTTATVTAGNRPHFPSS